ncbi:hypothetical protein HUZ36_14715 [Pseudoalteromonas sp. McH1-7]|uniref:hypothetical protein n=1 Tax=Pseudoalteromonas TaxID=53246 RepID=UPI000FFF4571|nr:MULTISPECIES: hypothetical protein [Pseudoalteromonas]MDW7548081.1 hypothetical protein [Pseudoalteromonas peptidolytica]NUZ12039.1 hypothetical protein [Pseudoalteromonas sp. McH1-7]RXF02558.1 hypothetical protein D9603_10260 [Pseudoalteromonas sp. PS5]USD27330.1 hypothetical protein J8Z24_10080 [Pseudoalteromonas sp. SCSIO 43201]
MFKFISWIFSITAFSLSFFFITQGHYTLCVVLLLAGLIALPKRDTELQPLGMRLHTKHFANESRSISSKEVINFLVAFSLAGLSLAFQWQSVVI